MSEYGTSESAAENTVGDIISDKQTWSIRMAEDLVSDAAKLTC